MMTRDLTLDAVRRSFCDHFAETVTLEQVRGEMTLTMPQTDPYGDSIVLYVTEHDYGIEISDGGFAHHELAAHTGRVKPSDELWNDVRAIATRHGVDFDSGHLCADAPDVSGIASAALAVVSSIHDGLALAKRGGSGPSIQFVEEVDLFFRDHRIPYEADVKIQGQSGAEHKIDFAIMNGRRHLVQAIGSENTMRKSLNTLYDVTERDTSAKFISFVDETRKTYSNTTYQQLEHKSKVFQWKDRNRFVEYWSQLQSH